jgi:ribosomal-protein-serine acetyltransferase
MLPHAITPDLSLRLLEIRHADALFQLTDENRAYLRVWLPWLDSICQAEDTRTFIRRIRRDFADSGAFTCGIWHEGEICGVIGHNRIDWNNKTSCIGYWLAENFQGKGIITTCCRAIIDHAFGELGLNKILIACGIDNAPSQAIPDRLGFVREGVVRDAEWLYDHFIDEFRFEEGVESLIPFLTVHRASSHEEP